MINTNTVRPTKMAGVADQAPGRVIGGGCPQPNPTPDRAQESELFEKFKRQFVREFKDEQP
jgi:hypothetical protein